MLAQVLVANNLTLVVGKEAVRLTPSEGFQLAERLIRQSTACMVEEEIGLDDPPESGGERARRKGRRQ